MTPKSKDRIPAQDVIEPKRWNLPYWTEPKHLVAKEDEVEVEEEEMDIEPLTAEQLEQIRQEAYNEGLEQGLIEGRQKGEKQGYEDGHAEGLKTGQETGHKLGYDAGLDEGKKQAEKEGKEKTDKKVSELTSVLQALLLPIDEQMEQLENVIPKLVITLAETVVCEELNQGSEHITQLSKMALESLPAGAKNIRVYVHELDLPYLEAAVEQLNLSWEAIEDNKLQPGGCRIESSQSLVDFTYSTRWKTIVEQYQEQLQIGKLEFEDDEAFQGNEMIDTVEVEEVSEPPNTNRETEEIPSEPQMESISDSQGIQEASVSEKSTQDPSVKNTLLNESDQNTPEDKS